MKNFFLFLCLGFFASFSWGQAQYQPVSSLERHELAIDFPFSLKSWKGFSALKYTVYFPEIFALAPSPYNQIFTPGLQAGILHTLGPNQTGKNYGHCGAKKTLPPYHIGFKGKISYFELLRPFFELGFTQSLCYAPKTSKIKLSHYVSFGLFLSLKTLDSSSIYSLDQDYGINDLGLKTECLRYYSEQNKEKSFPFCQFGFQISF